MTEPWILGPIVLGVILFGGLGLGWLIFWLWWDPIYHPYACRCRRCRWQAASEARKKARLERASRR